MAEACRALSVPVIGGNVSLYNESRGRDIDPTPVVGTLGLVDRLERRPPGIGLVEGSHILVGAVGGRWAVGTVGAGRARQRCRPSALAGRIPVGGRPARPPGRPAARPGPGACTAGCSRWSATWSAGADDLVDGVHDVSDGRPGCGPGRDGGAQRGGLPGRGHRRPRRPVRRRPVPGGRQRARAATRRGAGPGRRGRARRRRASAAPAATAWSSTACSTSALAEAGGRLAGRPAGGPRSGRRPRAGRGEPIDRTTTSTQSVTTARSGKTHRCELRSDADRPTRANRRQRPPRETMGHVPPDDADGDHDVAAGGLRGLRRSRPGQPSRPPDLRRPVRPAAPGPGVGWHGGQRRRRDRWSSRTWAWSPTSSTSATWPASRATWPSATPATRPPGASTWHNAQPVYRTTSPGPGQGEPVAFALGHNGNLTNTEALAAEIGMLPGTVTQRQRPDRRAAGPPPRSPPRRRPGSAPCWRSCPRLEGAFSLVLLDHERLIGVRDPHGFRPLCLGQARRRAGCWRRRRRPSTSPAPTSCGSSNRASCWSSTPTGPASLQPWPAERIDPKLCLFEFVYLARPDSRLYGQELHSARIRMGELLAEQAPAVADMVMGVPDSGLPAAEGYARRSGIRYGQGLVKNRYIGRTFIVPDQAQRAQGVRRKLNPLRGAIAGQRLVVVDDSIVRGTTTRAMVRDAARGRGRRGPPADLVAAVPVALLLRAGHRDPVRADRRQPRGRRDPGVPGRRQPGLPRASTPSRRRRGRREPASATPASPGDYPVRVPGARCGRGARRSVRRFGSSPTARVRARHGGSRARTSPAGRSHLRRGRGRHRRRRPGRRRHAGPGAVDHGSARGARAASAASAGCSRCRPATAGRCWCRAPTGSAPRWRWPWPLAASTPSGSTWWPCAWTTWCAAAPGRCFSSTTSCWAGSTPSRSARS